MLTLGVGGILNMINQGDSLFGKSEVVLWKVGLTFLVPFCVSTFASWTAIVENRAHVSKGN